MAMGTRFAPSHATLVMGYMEEKLYEKVGKTYKEYIQKWKRFLGGGFIFLKKSKDVLNIFNGM